MLLTSFIAVSRTGVTVQESVELDPAVSQTHVKVQKSTALSTAVP